MKLAKVTAKLTSCWWREVGAVLVEDEKLIFQTFNRHVPNENSPYVFGDPRDSVPSGEKSELSTAIHAEQNIIAWAAKEGIGLRGKYLYTTVFPCPVCVKLIAYSGISKLFFLTGHSSLGGENILRSQNVEIVLVK
jgi:dCMP deaminase